MKRTQRGTQQFTLSTKQKEQVDLALGMKCDKKLQRIADMGLNDLQKLNTDQLKQLLTGLKTYNEKKRTQLKSKPQNLQILKFNSIFRVQQEEQSTL